jgi:hypothetical protein
MLVVKEPPQLLYAYLFLQLSNSDKEISRMFCVLFFLLFPRLPPPQPKTLLNTQTNSPGMRVAPCVLEIFERISGERVIFMLVLYMNVARGNLLSLKAFYLLDRCAPRHCKTPIIHAQLYG